jgi:predicted DNA-binding transcriptional regulator YafY
LRHYDRRWYVGGFSHDPEEQIVRTFPLEHDKPADYNAETYWKHIYGITVPPKGRVEQVVLAFTPIQGKYFLSMPFYEPFTVLEDTPERLVVQMELMPNIDLERKLTSFGAAVRVLSPEPLALTVKEMHRKAWEQYG